MIGTARGGSPLFHRIPRGAPALLGYMAIAVVATWPLATRTTRVLPGIGVGDQFFTAFVLEWVYRHLTAGMAGFWDPPIFFPKEHILSYSDHDLGLQLFYAPARLMGAGQALAYNTVFLGELVLSGWGAYLLARSVVATRLPAFLAGAMFELLPYRIYHTAHVHLLALGFTPLALLFSERTMASGRTRDAVAAALSFFLAFLSAFYVGMYTALLLGVYVACRVAYQRPPWRSIVALSLPCTLALAVLVAIHLPMARTKAAHGIERSVEETVTFSARVADYAAPSPWSLSRHVMPWGKVQRGERLCYLGIAPMALAAVGLRRRTRGGLMPYTLAAAGMFILSLGPRLVLWDGMDTGIPLPYRLLRSLPAFDVLRVPARLSAFMAAALVPAVASGAASILGGRRGPAVAVALLAFHVGDGWAVPFMKSEPIGNPCDDAAYAEVSKVHEPLAIVEIPADVEGNVEAMLGSFCHGLPIVNGYTSVWFPDYLRLHRSLVRFPSPETIAALRGLVREDLRVRRVIWRRRPGFEHEFEEARRAGKAFPAAPLMADLGDSLVFGLRETRELFEVIEGDAVSYPRTKPDPADLEIAIRHGRWEGDAIVGHRPGSVEWRATLRPGPARIGVTVDASPDGPRKGNLSLGIALDGVTVVERSLPWNERTTIESPGIAVKVGGRYQISIFVRMTGEETPSRPFCTYRLSDLWLTAP